VTHAVCFNCGAMKWGAITPCPACCKEPETPSDVAYSFGLCDHFVDIAQLEAISQRMLGGGPRPSLTEEDEKRLIELFAADALRVLRRGRRPEPMS
jgi:hypothetical protein